MADAFQENLDRVKAVAEDHGHILNPNEMHLNKMLERMVKNFEQFGKYYCPCKQHHPLDPEQDPFCPCPEMDEEVVEDGHCECWVFFRKEK